MIDFEEISLMATLSDGGRERRRLDPSIAKTGLSSFANCFTSFETLPIATAAPSMVFIQGFISWSAHMFLGAIAIAFPIIFGLLLVNTSLGIVSRAAPSLNVFAVGFPALIPAGLIMLLLTMAIWFEQVENLWFLGFDTLRQAILG